MENRASSFQSNKVMTNVICPNENSYIEVIGGAPNVRGIITNSPNTIVEILNETEPEVDQILQAISDCSASWTDDSIPIVGLIEMPEAISEEKAKKYIEPHQIEVNAQGLTNPMMNVAPVWRKLDFDDASDEIEVNFQSDTYLKSLGDICYLNLNVSPIKALTNIKQFCLSLSEFPKIKKEIQSTIVSITTTTTTTTSLLCEAMLDDEMLYVYLPQELPKNTTFSLQGNLVFLKKE